MLKKFRRRMFPITLSKGLDIVEEISPKNNRPEHWCRYPVTSLIEHIGNLPVRDVTPKHVKSWLDHTQARPSQRDASKRLSHFTVRSYAKALQSYFNRLRDVGHIDTNPVADLRLPKLPRKGKKEISQEELALMVQYSDRNPRDRAIVLTLRDSGCRVGGLVTMTVSGLTFEEYDDEGVALVRGRAVVLEKMNKMRYIYFGNECALAIQRYLKIRIFDAPDDLWLTHTGRPITTWGIYQVLKRIAQQAGVKTFNPHAFRHATAKRLLLNGAPPRVVQEILGHEDVTTTMNLYVNFDEKELQLEHQKYNKLK
jgi:site-specific recombinase XerD